MSRSSSPSTNVSTSRAQQHPAEINPLAREHSSGWLLAMAHRLWRFGSSLLARVRTHEGHSFACGAVTAVYVIAFCHQMAARFGDGLAMTVGTLAAVSLAICFAALRISRPGARPRGRSVALFLVPAVWALAFGALSDAVGSCCRGIDLDRLASPFVEYAVAFGASLVLLGIPTACGTRLLLKNSWLRGGWLLGGAVAGATLSIYLIGPTLGIQWGAWLAVALSMGAMIARACPPLRAASEDIPPHNSEDVRKLEEKKPVYLFSASSAVDSATRPDLPRRTQRGAEEACLSEFELPDGLTPRGSASETRKSAILGLAVGSVIVGIMAAGLERLTFQLFPNTEAEQWTCWVGFLVGTAFGGKFVRRRSAAPAILAAAFCAALPIIGFGALINLFLVATANVAHVSFVMLIRGLAAGAMFFPVGMIWGTISNLSRPDVDSDAMIIASRSVHPSTLLRVLPAVFLGFMAARCMLLQGLTVPAMVGSGAALFAAFGMAVAFRTQSPVMRISGAVGLLCSVATMAVGYLERTYDPSRAAQLLFSTNVFMAKHSGTEARLLPFLDDDRFIDSEEGERGTYTVWKRLGAQLHLRECGIPKGAYCTRPDICPQFPNDTLPAILPLLLHEAPRSVLILGIGSGSTLETCLEFPIADVTCMEGDRALIRLIDRTIWSAGQFHPRSDNRVRIVEIDPVWGVLSCPGSFDVIISDTDQAGVAAGTPYYTHEFYAHVAGQLGVDGIFAQRFQQVDFGPWPLRSLLATLNSVFTNVAAVEGGQGELVLLATNSERGLSRPGLLTRFQTPQAVRTFAQIGWDWSVALNLGSYSGDGCAALLEVSPNINTAANGFFAYRLPQEMMRWGPKQNEIAQVLGPSMGRIAQWPDVDGKDPELLRRLSEVVTQHNLMTRYPDQPWAYRKAVRENLKKNPRIQIKEAADGLERQLDAVDQRRVEYFAALGKVARTANPRREDVRRLEEFSEPYDPVVTYFLHHELAGLCARAGDSFPDVELQHRLYTVYYGDPHDRSVRDVVQALSLIAKNPQLLGDSQSWDHMNALLELLKCRWTNRGLVKPPSLQIALNDLDRTISAAESAFTEMEKLRGNVGFTESDWQARREMLERSLVGPLRSYRAHLIPLYQKEIQRNAATEKTARSSAN